MVMGSKVDELPCSKCGEKAKRVKDSLVDIFKPKGPGVKFKCQKCGNEFIVFF